jgi:hypothetical protein
MSQMSWHYSWHVLQLPSSRMSFEALALVRHLTKPGSRMHRSLERGDIAGWLGSAAAPIDTSFNNSGSLGFSREVLVIATILGTGLLILLSCMNSNGRHLTHSVLFLPGVFFRRGLTY